MICLSLWMTWYLVMLQPTFTIVQAFPTEAACWATLERVERVTAEILPAR